ncbi:MAG: SMP-30/gluconolactonase/LRE family protein [Pedosphaera sp.]|nr:SMP-30/gluconolactonase/LRE family protein [Pedosphaera sp.]
MAARAAGDFDVRDEAEFKKIFPNVTQVDASIDGAASSNIKKLAGNLGFLEGPVWNSAGGGFVVFSDIPGDELKKWSEKEGLASFRKPSNNANGNCLDLQGRLITCEHGARRVSITEKDGSIHTLMDQFEGKKLNSPNDVVVKSDGTVWFTDPDYGLGGKPKEQEGNYVFRVDPKAKSIKVVVKDFDKPNGLCFSPDEKKLYIADSGKPRHIRVFDVQRDGLITNGRVFCAIDKGGPDGIRCDKDGRIFSSAGDGVQMFAPDGHLIGKILVPESPANLCFGGPENKTLYITARKSLYSVSLSARGNK